MRILFYIDCLGSGGKERRLVELMKQLLERPDIHFELALMNSNVHYKEVLDFGVRIHYLVRKRKKDFSVFKRLYKVCKEYRPDVVHCWDSMTAVYSVPACKLLGIRLVNGMITDAPADPSLRNKRWFRARLTFPFSDAIVGNSMAGLKAYRASRSKCVCIHNGFSFERLKNLPTEEAVRRQLNINTEYIVGMVASFADNKDYKTYYKAAQMIIEKGGHVTFLSIGNGTDSEGSLGLIPEKYTANFRLLGKISNVESIVNAMDIGVLSTFTEGISNAILEYMALGKVVVASSGGGTNELVSDGATGFLVTPSNPAELAEKMELLLNDRELRRKMGEAGRRRIADEFSIERMVNKFLDLYKDLCPVPGDRAESPVVNE